MKQDDPTRREPTAPDDFDSPWKILLDRWAQPFLEFFFPVAAADIDWSQGLEFLDKELQKVTRRSAPGLKGGRHEVDKLIKVCRRGGEETWVLVHVEIQGQSQPDFARRMYLYHSRLSDRYRRPVASFAVLTDDSRRWRPRRYEQRLWGCRALLEFPTAKLLDHADREAELAADPNPFALVVRAHLAALSTRRDPAARLERKISLTRALYRQGWTREDILSLYAFLDWVLTLPEALEADYHQRIREIEEGQQMQYVTTAERIGFKKGIEQGIEQGIERGESRLLYRLLQRRFGPLPEWVETRLTQASTSELETWGERLLDAATLEAVFRT